MHWLTMLSGTPPGWSQSACGYLASALVLCTFSVTSMRLLRCIGIASNVTFICYAAVTGATPILVLHCLLLPMNIYRLSQIRPFAAAS